IRRTMRIREGDPLEIYTSKDGEVIFKKYSIMGDLDEFSAQICETMSKSVGQTVAVADRDSIIAISGGFKRELLGKHISQEMEQIMEDRRIFQYTPGLRSVPVTEENDTLFAALAAPVISEGDAMGLVFFVTEDLEKGTGETEYKLAQTIAALLGRHMES
ncbi:MAG: stage V sporulation T C-terminal domain-containing protein, partial [Candidatus Limivicinus sp.]